MGTVLAEVCAARLFPISESEEAVETVANASRAGREAECFSTGVCNAKDTRYVPNKLQSTWSHSVG